MSASEVKEGFFEGSRSNPGSTLRFHCGKQAENEMLIAPT